MGFDFQRILTQDKLAKKRLERILKEISFYSNRNALAAFPLEFIDDHSKEDKDTLVLILQCDKTTSKDIAGCLSTTSDERRKSILTTFGKTQNQNNSQSGKEDPKQRRASLQTIRQKQFQNWRSQSLDLDKLKKGKENWIKVKGVFDKHIQLNDKKKQQINNKQNGDKQTKGNHKNNGQTKGKELTKKSETSNGEAGNANEINERFESVVDPNSEDINKVSCENVLNEKPNSIGDVVTNQTNNSQSEVCSPTALQQISENKEIADEVSSLIKGYFIIF